MASRRIKSPREYKHRMSHNVGDGTLRKSTHHPEFGSDDELVCTKDPIGKIGEVYIIHN